MQAQLAWQRSRHHIRVKPHLLLQAATAAPAASTATFSFLPTARQLAFLWDHQLYGTGFVPLGCLLEMGSAAVAACLGDGSSQPQQLVITNAAVPTLAQLPAVENAAEAPAMQCSLSLHSGQLQVAAGPTVQLCLDAQLQCTQVAAAAIPAQLAHTSNKVSNWHHLC